MHYLPSVTAPHFTEGWKMWSLSGWLCAQLQFGSFIIPSSRAGIAEARKASGKCILINSPTGSLSACVCIGWKVKREFIQMFDLPNAKNQILVTLHIFQFFSRSCHCVDRASVTHYILTYTHTHIGRCVCVCMCMSTSTYMRTYLHAYAHIDLHLHGS